MDIKIDLLMSGITQEQKKRVYVSRNLSKYDVRMEELLAPCQADPCTDSPYHTYTTETDYKEMGHEKQNKQSPSVIRVQPKADNTMLIHCALVKRKTSEP